MGTHTIQPSGFLFNNSKTRVIAMKTRKLYSSWFYVPALLIYTVLFVVPALTGLGYSLTDWNTNRVAIHFVGLRNYSDIFQSSGPYLGSIEHTAIFTVSTLVLKTVIGLALALFLNEKLKTRNQLRAVYFLPYTISPLIIGIIFIAILAPKGPLNTIFNLIGLGSLSNAWLSEKGTALLSTIAVETWRMAGWNMAIFLAGLQMIPKEYYEAASIDGANVWQKFRSVTLPFLMPSVSIAVVLNLIHGLRVFDIIYALTGGGPGQLTEVINTQVFQVFSNGLYGMANALSVIVTVFTLLFALTMKRALTGEGRGAK